MDQGRSLIRKPEEARIPTQAHVCGWQQDSGLHGPLVGLPYFLAPWAAPLSRVREQKRVRKGPCRLFVTSAHLPSFLPYSVDERQVFCRSSPQGGAFSSAVPGSGDP